MYMYMCTQIIYMYMCMHTIFRALNILNTDRFSATVVIVECLLPIKRIIRCGTADYELEREGRERGRQDERRERREGRNMYKSESNRRKEREEEGRERERGEREGRNMYKSESNRRRERKGGTWSLTTIVTMRSNTFQPFFQNSLKLSINFSIISTENTITVNMSINSNTSFNTLMPTLVGASGNSI